MLSSQPKTSFAEKECGYVRCRLCLFRQPATLVLSWKPKSGPVMRNPGQENPVQSSNGPQRRKVNTRASQRQKVVTKWTLVSDLGVSLMRRNSEGLRGGGISRPSGWNAGNRGCSVFSHSQLQPPAGYFSSSERADDKAEMTSSLKLPVALCSSPQALCIFETGVKDLLSCRMS
jgi:hypothetical protein